MDRVRFVTHQGKQILFIDMTNCVSEEATVIASEVQRIVTAQLGAHLERPHGRRVQARCDHPNEGSCRLRQAIRKRAAIVGAESLPNAFYEALQTFSRREFHRFNTREEAMNWLIREETR